MTAQGEIYVIHPKQQKSEKFSLRNFILDQTEEVNNRVIVNYIECQVFNKNCELLDAFNVGDVVEVAAEVGSNSVGTDKNGLATAFNNISVFKIKLIKEGAESIRKREAAAAAATSSDAGAEFKV